MRLPRPLIYVVSGLTIYVIVAVVANFGDQATSFDSRAYIGQGDSYSCEDFANQAQSQAVLRADPKDPNYLDMDRDGLACENRPGPRDVTPVAVN